MLNTLFRNSIKYPSMQYCKSPHPINERTPNKNKKQPQKCIATIFENSLSLFIKNHSSSNVADKSTFKQKISATHLNTFDSFSKSDNLSIHSLKLPKNQKTKELLINNIEKKISSSAEKQLAYAFFVKFFNIDSFAKFAGFRYSRNSLFAIEAAKYAAAINGDATSEIFESYRIEDQKARIEIAKIAISQDACASIWFENYGIEDEKARIEIAKIAAVQNGRATSGFIERFKIRDQAALIEIAKIAAAQNGEYTSYFILNYRIRSQAALIEIAKIAVAQSGIASELIEIYTITNETSLIEIAKVAAAHNGILLSKNIKKYYIQDQVALLNIFLIALVSSQGKASEHLSNYKFSEDMCLNSESMHIYLKPELLNSFDLLSQKDVDFSKVSESLSSFSTSQEWPSLEEIFSKTLQKDPFIQKQVFFWLTIFLGYSSHKKISSEQLKLILEGGFLTSVLNYADPKMRFQLTNLLVELMHNEVAKKHALSLLIIKHPPHTKIPILIISSLYAQGIDLNVCDLQLKTASKSMLRDGKNLRIYVNSIHIILKSKELNTEDKQHLLLQINSQNLMPTLYAIQVLQDLNKISQLNKSHLENTSLSNILEDNIRELIPTKKIDNFSEKYVKYFSGTRVPNFILTYAAKLHSNTQLLKCLGIGLDGILADVFPEMRYNTQKSEHLQKVFFEDLDLFKEWKKGEKAPLGTFLVNTEAKDKSLDFFKIFKEKLIDHEHLKAEYAPLLFDYLNQTNTFEETLSEIENQLHSNENTIILNIQKNCLKLTIKELSFDDQKQILKEIDKDLNTIIHDSPQFSEFQNDIKGILTGLIKENVSKENYNKFTIEDTDHYIDLFLSGTEVGGSCLRISGDPSFNKCLMAYVFDGKNRLLAVKDKDGKIIARSLLRILWDEKEKKPILFMERIYPTLVDPKLDQGLVDFAVKRAKKMHLTLLMQDPTKPEYTNPIFSFGSLDFIHHEYSDAVTTSRVTNGKFTIDSSNIVFSPDGQNVINTAGQIQEILEKIKFVSE